MRRTVIVPTLILLVLTGCGSLNRQLAEAKNDLTLMRADLTSMRQTMNRLVGSIKDIKKNTKRAATAEAELDRPYKHRVESTDVSLPALTSE